MTIQATRSAREGPSVPPQFAAKGYEGLASSQHRACMTPRSREIDRLLYPAITRATEPWATTQGQAGLARSSARPAGWRWPWSP